MSDIPNPNERQYAAVDRGHYLATRLISHGGTTIAIALGTSSDEKILFFDYSILNATDQKASDKDKSQDATDRLDSQRWFENAKRLRFPSEVRVVGEEAVPVYELAAVDRTGRRIDREDVGKLDVWKSTTISLMDPASSHFEVLSDGKYIYLFRQSLAASGQSGQGRPPWNANLLCDRFTLVGSTLNRTLEVRYRRSRQKRLPLNDKDTLAVRDMNDVSFYEPTFSMTFVNDMVDGQFTILQTPTMTNGMTKWMIFAYSKSTSNIECFTTDVAADGLFDIHGKIYYTCANDHDKTFSTSPGTCGALKKKGGTCENARTAMVSKGANSGWALSCMGKPSRVKEVQSENPLVQHIKKLGLQKPIDLSASKFAQGFTLEAWILISSADWDSTSVAKADSSATGDSPNAEGSKDSSAKKEDADNSRSKDEAQADHKSASPPLKSMFRLFSFSKIDTPMEDAMHLALDDHLRLVVRASGDDTILAETQGLDANRWTHIAFSFAAGSDGKPPMLNLIVDGKGLDSTKSGTPRVPGRFSLNAILSQPEDEMQQFHGALDEVRLWSYPLQPASVKSRMSTRATGMEPYLEACWHFDEGTGTQTFDASSNAHHVSMTLEDETGRANPPWIRSTASISGAMGLSKRTIRLSPGVSVSGGLRSVVYFEQVSITPIVTAEGAETKPAVKEEHGSKTQSASKPEPKPLKRGARVLLSFVATATPDSEHTLAVLDFGLLSDGTLCEWPAVLPIQTIKAINQSGRHGKYAPMTLIWVDGQGVELFGGILDFPAARCARDPPFVWDSSTGTVTVFYRSAVNEDGSKHRYTAPGRLCALVYDISRSVELNVISSLSDYSAVLAAARLRQAKGVSIETTAAKEAPETVAVDIKISATLLDDSQIEELWRCVPASIGRACNLIGGQSQPAPFEVGKVRRFDKNSDKKYPGLNYLIQLEEGLEYDVLAATCIEVKGWRMLVLQDARKRDREIFASRLAQRTSTQPIPRAGALIKVLGYDYEVLLKSVNKPAAAYTQGSAILSLAVSTSSTDGKVPSEAHIKIGAKALVSARGQSPYFASPAPSSALQLKNNAVYSMLEPVVGTPPTPGLAFESWIKVDQVTESVLVAYVSERLPRSDDAPHEQQIFVLTIPATSSGKKEYELACNANGMTFSVANEQALKQAIWVHFACSLHNVLALAFSGTNYVDFGAAAEFNVSNFTLTFTLRLDELGRNHVVLTKMADGNGNAPIHVTVTNENRLCLAYWAEDETSDKVQRREVMSPKEKPLEKGKAYKIFISRKLEQVPKKEAIPRKAHCVTMKAWESDDGVRFELQPPSMHDLEEAENKKDASRLQANTEAQACGSVVSNESPLLLGGTTWNQDGLKGVIGPIRLYSAAIPLPISSSALTSNDSSARSLIASWSFLGSETTAVIDDTGRNHGKLKKEPKWLTSPFTPDHRLFVYVNGLLCKTSTLKPDSPILQTPAGPHQLTLGNTIHDFNGTRFQYLGNGFRGEFDELRIWNVPRTRENVCDTMNARLVDIPPEVAVYLPFDVEDISTIGDSSIESKMGILTDLSVNCWHLTPMYSAAVGKVVSQAPVGRDATCVRHVHGSMEFDDTATGATVRSSPAVTEYGQMSTGASGELEGSYKRAYSFIDSDGHWRLDTGFRIGTLITQWVSQIQTSPTLIGYIEGAPPVPAENYVEEKHTPPMSSIKFSNPTSIQYSYGLRSEHATDLSLTTSRGLGAEWKVNAGLGVETEVSAGKIKAAFKQTLDVSNAQFSNDFLTMKTHTNLDMKMELTGAWRKKSQGSSFEGYDPANTGLALVESEVADVFSLRLKMRGSVAPLVAYQMRPNPDIPKDRNLVSFRMNKAYTKQGCLDGLRNNEPDEDYGKQGGAAPKDVSYYKPIEAYALKERIRRAEEQLAGEYERYAVTGKPQTSLPSRAHRNICNSYVWTADGGTFQEVHSTMDFVQHEVGGNSSTRNGIGGTFDMEASAGCVLCTASIDALYSTHVNVMRTKDKQTEEGFELLADFPQPIELRELLPGTQKFEKRPGAVDAYRWMSFWLEPSTEGTDAFFQRVLDPLWLASSPEPTAALLRDLRDALQKDTGSARTKAWRLFHRVTYVSRVLDAVSNTPQDQTTTAAQLESQAGTLLADISCNWLILQKLEPQARGAATRVALRSMLAKSVDELYPTIRANPKLYDQLLELIGDYLGLA